jgi:hypothetical protein
MHISLDELQLAARNHGMPLEALRYDVTPVGLHYLLVHFEQVYERSLPVADALAGDALLAHELNGAPLPPQHGFPLRLVVPGWYGMTSVKWLERITVLDRPFDGYQQTLAYRFRRDEDDEGEPLTRMRPRALMVPAGVPDFLTRRRFLGPGRRVLEGRAWSGLAPVAAVEVSLDAAPAGRPPSSSLRRTDGPGRDGRSGGVPSPVSTSSPAARATKPATSSRSSQSGTSAATRTTRPGHGPKLTDQCLTPARH